MRGTCRRKTNALVRSRMRVAQFAWLLTCSTSLERAGLRLQGAGVSQAGPTIIKIDFDGLDALVDHLAQAGRSAKVAHRNMGSVSVSPGAFGLLNAPLALTTGLLASRVGQLSGDLASVTPRAAQNAEVARDAWRKVDAETERILTRLRSAIDALEDA